MAQKDTSLSPLLGGAPPAEGLPGMSAPSPLPAAEAPTAQGTSAGVVEPSITEKMLSHAQGRFDAVEKVYKQLGRIRKGLDGLIEKGDAVTSDDVLDEMALLVAHGADPKSLAAIVAGNTAEGIGPMPPGGEALSGWLLNTEASIVAPAEAALKPAMALARHQLGVSAVHAMLGAHGASAPQAAAPPPSPLLH